jgi:hypothetical protein
VLSASDFKAQTEIRRGTRDSGAALRRDSAVALLAFGGILFHLCFRIIIHSTPTVARVPLYIVLATGGLPLIVVLILKCMARPERFELPTLWFEALEAGNLNAFVCVA